MNDGYLMHYNPNHDPKTGRFTTVPIYQKRAMKAAKTKKYVDDIIESLSYEDADKVLILDNMPRKEFNTKKKKHELYLTSDEGEFVVNRALLKIGDVPVSFLDLLDNGDNLSAAIATRSGSEYRRKGYAEKVAKKTDQWIKRNPDKLKDYKYINWWSLDSNDSSKKIAENHGYTLEKKVNENGRVYSKYVKRLHNNKEV